MRVCIAQVTAEVTEPQPENLVSSPASSLRRKEIKWNPGFQLLSGLDMQ